MSVFKKIDCCDLRRRLHIELRCINRKKSILSAILFVVIGIADAIICGNFYIYEMLILPKSAPGRWLFILVWTFIYAILGFTFQIVLAEKSRHCSLPRVRGCILFVCMMIFNLIWCPLFFGASAFFSAFLNILIMILLVFFTAIYFWQVSIIASIAQFVLEIWLIYCAFLNLGIILIN